ncbi:MAG: SusF/SusE family outer membrane protein [Muribaculaceae bacterium]|nr:SusF/SusE family outer membrane protein [Muribaculaceae bacterium]
MRKIYIFALMLGTLAFTACDSDRDDNPVLPEQSTLTLTLNEPEMANTIVDVAHCEKIVLVTSQPNYGFPVVTRYTAEMSLNENMSDAVTLSTASSTPRLELIGNEVASSLTTLELAAGKAEEDFPMDIKAYFRVKAGLQGSDGLIEGTEVLSNVVSLNIRLDFSLPAVNVPDNLYITGQFNGWDWGTCLNMTKVYGAENVFWHMVYIDESGIKFNNSMAWDGNERGFTGIRNISGALASQIIDSGGNIASSAPGWYLMVVTASVEGRDIIYDVAFEAPDVWLMGPCIGDTNWSELNEAGKFTVPTKADGEFVSPAFTGSCPGGDGDGVRVYVKVPGYDWWKSEFIVGLDGKKISYRGTGGDQARVAGTVGQQMYLNFTKDTGEIK